MKRQRKPGRDEAVERNPQEDEGVHEGDHGALAVSEDGELGHKQLTEFHLPGGDCVVIFGTAYCDWDHS
jgi:hypothetical protein